MKNIFACCSLLFIAVIVLSIFSCSNSPEKKNKSLQPNIIFILADDLGYGDLACYGHPYAKTPNIDKLATEGVLLKRFYAAAATCAPSRAAFMTGKYPASFEQLTSKNGFGNQVTITELLKTLGYKTAHVGKWHMGPHNDNLYGFDKVVKAMPNSNSPEGRDKNTFDKAIDFIIENKATPFYINICGTISHFPISTPEKELLQPFRDLAIDRSQFDTFFNVEKLDVLDANSIDVNNAMKNYLASIYSLDLQVGKIVQILKELGLEDNTLIIFASDQGPDGVTSVKVESTQRKNDRFNMLGYAGKLNGGKHGYFEGGIRVPFIAKWPKGFRKNYVDDVSVVSAVDFLPTLCSIVGIDLSNYDLDGKNKLEVFKGNPELRSTPLFWRAHENNLPVTILKNDWKLHEVQNGKPKLFNLKNDPKEQNDVALYYPLVVQQLTDDIKKWTNTLPLNK